jgi:hypothetical protein
MGKVKERWQGGEDEGRMSEGKERWIGGEDE